MEGYLGTIMLVAYPWAPTYWMTCEGQELPISQYQGLFSVIGSRFGGTKDVSFKLPDLRGCVPIGATVFNTVSNGRLAMSLGATTGANSETVRVAGSINIKLTEANLPPHAHQVSVGADKLKATSTMHVTPTGGAATPVNGAALGTGSASGGGQAFIYVASATPTVPLNDASVTTTVEPFLVQSANSGGGTVIDAPFSASPEVSTLQPSLGLNFIICVNGLYPDKG